MAMYNGFDKKVVTLFGTIDGVIMPYAMRPGGSVSAGPEPPLC